jgi:hypothetical protein
MTAVKLRKSVCIFSVEAIGKMTVIYFLVMADTLDARKCFGD